MKDTSTPNRQGHELSPVLLPGRACATCRRLKIRCDSGRPVCGNCFHNSRECVYVPRKTKLQGLQERLATLEQAVSIVESSNSSIRPSKAHSRDPACLDIPELVLSLGTPLPYTDNRLPDLESWNPQHELPVHLRIQLLEVFLTHRSIWNVDLHVERWRNAIHLPPTHPESFHPALINAIAAVAASLCTSDYQSFVDLFLQRAVDLAADSLAFCDRVEDWIYTQILLIWYWSRVGNGLTAVSASSAVVALGLACNLHQLSNPSQHASHNWGILTPPLDDLHAAERVNLWWTLYLLDRLVAMLAAVPGICPLEQFPMMSTPLPVSYSDVSERGLAAYPWITLSDIFRPRGVSAEERDLSGDTLLALRLKSATILACTGYTAYKDSEPPGEREARLQSERPDWANFEALEEHISMALITMPDIMDGRGRELTPLMDSLSLESTPSLSSSVSSLNSDDNPFEFLKKDLDLDLANLADLDVCKQVNPVIARATIETLHAAIVLYNGRSELEPSRKAEDLTISKDGAFEERLARERCYTRRLAAARSMAYITRRVGDIKSIYIPMCIAPPFCLSANVIIKELRRLSPLAVLYSHTETEDADFPTQLAPSSPEYIEQLKLDLETVISAAELLSDFFPGLQSYVDRVRNVYLPSITRKRLDPRSQSSP